MNTVSNNGDYSHLQYYAPGVEHACDNIPEMTYSDFIDPSIKKYGNRIFYGNPGHAIDFSTIYEQADLIARALRGEFNVNPDDVVLSYGVFTPGMSAILKALNDIGACPYNLKLSASEQDFTREVTGNLDLTEQGISQRPVSSTAIVFDAYYSIAPIVKKLYQDPRLKKVLVVDIADFLPFFDSEYKMKPILQGMLYLDKKKKDALLSGDGKFIRYSEALKIGKHFTGDYRPEFKPNRWATITTSSGSSNSGVKPTIATNEAIIGQILQCEAAEFGYESRDVIYLCLPPTVSTAMICMYVFPLYKGCDIYMNPRPSLKTFYQDIKKARPQHTVSTGTWWTQFFFEMLEELEAGIIKPGDFNFLKTIMIGGEGVSPEVLERMYTVLDKMGMPRHAIINGWGLSEGLAPMAKHHQRSAEEQAAHPEERKKHEVISVGPIMPAFKITIRDKDGKVLPDGTPGEIWAESKLITKGYFNKPELTAETIAEDGQLMTSDYGYRLNGQIYVIGRMNDTILLPNGEEVYVSTIANKIRRSHPAFNNCSCKKHKLEDGSEIILAHLGLWPEYKGREDEVLKEASANLELTLPDGVFELISGYHIWGRTLPASPTTAKVDPKQLIAQPDYVKPSGDTMLDITVEHAEEDGTYRIFTNERTHSLVHTIKNNSR